MWAPRTVPEGRNRERRSEPGWRQRTFVWRPAGARCGAQDRASPNFMRLASLGLDIGIFCDFLYRVLLSALLELYLLGPLSRPQASWTAVAFCPLQEAAGGPPPAGLSWGAGTRHY